MNFKKINYGIVLAILLPIIFLIVLSIATYYSGLSRVKPTVDFVYSTEKYNPSFSYKIVDNKIVENPVQKKCDYDCIKQDPKLYLHNIANDNSKEISFEEAQKLKLSDDIKSKDGFEFMNYYSSSRSSIFFPLNYQASENILLKDGYLYPQNLTDTNNEKIKFVGWITE